VGIYIFWIGADFPGGKFQGATILATMWLLVIGAGLAYLPPISRAWLRILLVPGPLVFMVIGFVGLVTAGAVFAYPDGYAKPLILAIEFALMPTLVLALALLVAGAPQRMPGRGSGDGGRPCTPSAANHRHRRRLFGNRLGCRTAAAFVRWEGLGHAGQRGSADRDDD
jgi:hypothetical protein